MIELDGATLDDDFWCRFRSEFWERRPCVIRAAGRPPIASDHELRGALANALRGGGRSDSSMRLYRGTAMEHGQHDAAFPTGEAEDLHAWARRLRGQGGDAGVLLVVNALQRFSPTIWQRARAFVRETGVVGDHRVDVDAFVGWYDRTPEGVHKDAASNFMFVVHGPKTMRFWPASAFDDPGARRDDFHANDAHVGRQPGVSVRVEPGDILYWPSNAWHVGASPSGLTACVNIPIYVDSDPDADLIEAVGQVLSGSCEVARGAESLETRADAEVQRLAAALDGGQLRERLLDRWLRRRSADGFERVPPPATGVSVQRSTVVAPRWGATLVSAVSGPGERLWAGNGHSMVLPDHSALAGLIERVAAMEPTPVDPLVAETVVELGGAADDDTAQVVVSIIETLIAWDVLTVVR